MKILSLHFKNLNSLYGEWHIDFTDPAYTENGLFLLCGPTGAGKSTILDAVCLALYGQTPRLGKITQTANEIMSKHTAECYALLHFESKGIRYYARFEQRKARNNPQGKLQDVERSIAQDSPEQILCRKKTEINDEIIKITGMDFQRFTRSILLAQGAFDSFLKAKDEEKSMLLEQITGTEIYSQISKTVFERAKTEKEAVKELTAKSEVSETLSAEETLSLQTAHKSLTEKQQAVNQKLQTAQKALLWYGELEKLQQNLAACKEKYSRLQSEAEKAADQKTALALAEKAEKVYPLHHIAAAQKNEFDTLNAAVSALNEALPQQEKQLLSLQEAVSTNSAAIHNLKQQSDAQKPLFDEIKKLDTLFADKEQTVKNAQKQLELDGNALQKLQKELANLTKELEETAQKRNAAETWLSSHVQYEALARELSAVTQKLQALQTTVTAGQKLKEQIAQTKQTAERSKEKLHKQEQKHNALQNADAAQQKQEQETGARLSVLLGGKLLRELQAERTHLEEKKYFLYKIASYEEQRKELQNGQPCPLCGAVHHPFAEEKLPEQGNIDEELLQLKNRIESIEKLQQEQEKLRLTLKQNKEQLALSSQTLQNLAEQCQEKETLLSRYSAERQELLDAYAAQTEELGNILQPFGFSKEQIRPEQTESIAAVLKNALSSWNAKQQEKQLLENALQEKDKKRIALQAELDTAQKNLTLKQADLQNENTSLAELKKRREALFGGKNPHTEEQKLLEQIRRAETAQEKLLQEKEKQQAEVLTGKEQLRTLQHSLAEKQLRLQQDNEKLQQALTAHGFASEAEFLAAKTDEKTLRAMQEFFRQLEQDLQVLQAQQNQLTENLKAEQSKNITAVPKETLRAEETALKETLQSLFISLGEIQEKLTQNEKNLAKHQSILAALEQQKQQAAKWESLNQLIGSADGKKFRTIAQGITFERVIRYANAKLQALQKRYLLVRSKEQPLCLNVLDTYQGGEIRAVQNLSGGESFIVSLSLALGLSQMASQNVSVDSLFLDEGFGTLDEESLDTALSALAGIQQEGKLIGIISHIGLLKERINTQITVQPAHGGKSVLQGPGCTKTA